MPFDTLGRTRHTMKKQEGASGGAGRRAAVGRKSDCGSAVCLVFYWEELKLISPYP
jgi:hypothetical protein